MAARGEHRHPPGDVGVERATTLSQRGATTALCRSRSARTTRSSDSRSPSAEVAHPGRRPAGAVRPGVAQIRAELGPGGRPHLLERLLDVGGGRVEEIRPRRARPEQVEQRARGRGEGPPGLDHPWAECRRGRARGPRAAAPPGQCRLHERRRGRAKPGARHVVGSEVDTNQDRLPFHAGSPVPDGQSFGRARMHCPGPETDFAIYPESTARVPRARRAMVTGQQRIVQRIDGNCSSQWLPRRYFDGGQTSGDFLLPRRNSLCTASNGAVSSTELQDGGGLLRRARPGARRVQFSGGSSRAPPAPVRTGTKVTGGTATWALPPSAAPNYIFPFASSTYFSTVNISRSSST